MNLCKKYEINRLYLEKLSEPDKEAYFNELDKFWDKVISTFDNKHSFWRKSVSSKMQPWENSVGYISLVLFSLKRMSSLGCLSKILIIANSIELKNAIIQWCHVNDIKIYKSSHIERDFSTKIFQKIRIFVSSLARIASCILKKSKTIGVKNYYRGNKTKKKTVLIASLLYPQSFKNNIFFDPFFGNLHKEILKNGYECIYISYILNKFDRSTVKSAARCTEVGINLIYSVISWGSLIKVFINRFFNKVKIQNAEFMDCDFSSFLNYQVSLFDFSFNIHAELFFIAVKKICQSHKFDKFIQTFEGNVHERACTQAFKMYSNGETIGYSHGVVYPLNLKIYLTGKESKIKPEVSKYICTGSYYRELFLNIGRNYDPLKVYSGCMIKYIPSSLDREEYSYCNQKNILVSFGGVESTANVADWMLLLPKSLKEYHFIFRFHPNMPEGKIMPQMINDIPINVTVSTGDLKADINKSFCVVYRHSSVGIQSIMNGVPAVYLNIDSPLSGDPIEALDKFKWTVNSEEEFYRVINDIRNMSKEKIQKQRLEAFDFINKYFAKPTPDNLRSFFE